MDLEKYKSFNTEEFTLDEQFLKIAKGYSVDGIYLKQFKNKFPGKSKEIDLATEIINGLQTAKTGLSIERKEVLLSQIFHRNKIKLRITFLKYAAAVLLLACLSIPALYILNSQTAIEDFASSALVQTENAELILADGQRVEIDSEQSKIEYTADGTTVSLNDSSKLEQSEPVSGESFNQMIVPFGKRSTILLSDGTHVWLNSGSRLIYPPVFGKKSREVFLEGEAYFEVSKNKHKPFFVRTDEFRVKVLGTKFSVQAFKNEKEYNTLLVEGKVSLSKNGDIFKKEQILAPNQKATFSESKENFRITEVEDTEIYIAWIYGYINFENEDLTTLSKRISRYYNIDIEVRAQNVESKFSGKLDLKDSPERIIDGLATIFKVKYEKQGEKIVFYE